MHSEEIKVVALRRELQTGKQLQKMQDLINAEKINGHKSR